MNSSKTGDGRPGWAVQCGRARCKMGERCPRMHVTVRFLSPTVMMKTRLSHVAFLDLFIF